MLSRLFGSRSKATPSTALPVQQFEESLGNGDLAGVQSAVRGGCNIDERGTGAMMTPLMVAAVNGHAETCQWLIEQGADVAARSEDGSTCLHWASMNGTEEVLALLTAAGANPDATDRKGWPAPFMSTILDRDDLLTFWLARSFDLNHRNADGQTLLHVAASTGKAACVAELIRRGADLEAKDSVGATPLLSALSHAQGQVARVLADQGANLHARDGRNATALHHAAWGGLLGACRQLIEAGVDARATDLDEETPLHTAARQGYPGIEQLLISHGAQVEARTRTGSSVADLREQAAGLRQVTQELALFALLPDEITASDSWEYVKIYQEIDRAEAKNDDALVATLRCKSKALLEDLVHQYRNNPTRGTGGPTVSVAQTTSEARRLHPPENSDW